MIDKSIYNKNNHSEVKQNIIMHNNAYYLNNIKKEESWQFR